MRLFGYYAWHTFVNQLKKLFKTWVLIFLVICGLIGGLIGYGAAKLEDIATGGSDIGIEDTVDDSEYDSEYDHVTPFEENPEFVSLVVECATGLVALSMYAFFAANSAKGGNSLFQPADVTLLFTSPLKPQAILFFRILTSIGTFIFISIYMGIQIPNLVLNIGLSVGVSLSLIYAWFFTLITAFLIRTFIYTYASTHEKVKKYISPALYALAAILAAVYIAYYKSSSLGPWEALLKLFTGSVTRYIPVWGWTKNIVYYALAGNAAMEALMCLLLTVFSVIFAYVIWQLKADFYEDAMARAEQVAELLRSSEENGLVRRNKKDRSDKIIRDGLNKGFGPSVYFHKSLYNRKRFAIAKVFTKTSITYLVTAVLVSMLLVNVFEFKELFVVALVLGLFVFYRTFGNPLAEDTSGQYFVLMPGSVSKKMFYSLLGSTVNCILDLVPALVVSCILLGASPIDALGWMLFIASIDIYGTIVGVFINLSVPVAAGKTIKQIVQVMFIYFGILPDAGIMAVGIALDYILLCSVISALVNIVIAYIFFTLSTNFIAPNPGEMVVRRLDESELKTAKKTFRRLIMFPIVMGVVGNTVAFLIQVLLDGKDYAFMNSNAYVWFISFAPMYLVGLPLGLLCIKGIKGDTLAKRKLSFIDFVKCLIVSLGVMYVGNIVGNLLSSLLVIFFGSSQEPVESTLDILVTGSSLFYVIAIAVIIGPIIEELIFRKIFIDRTKKYGTKLAIVTSAVAFGLFHGNPTQAVYATCLGLILGYVYASTGDIKYSIGLHMCVNFIGTVIPTVIAEKVDLSMLESLEDLTDMAEIQIPGIGYYAALLIFIIVMVIAGFIILFSSLRKLSFDNVELTIQRRKRFNTAFVNAGMFGMLIYFVVMSILSLGLFI